MGSKRYYKKYIEKLIDSNPTTIVIKRYIEKDDGYSGKIKEEITLEPQEVAIYDKKAQREIVSEAGQVIGYMSSNIEKLLATADADIEEKDIFVHEGRKYKVAYVKNYMDICKQAELEVIENV